MVWVRKVDETGRKSDAATGFVVEPNAIATAFQAVDSARGLEVEFADGRKAKTDQVFALSRTGDWAILKVDTGSLAPIPSGNPKEVSVGERLLAFNVDSNVRVIGGVDIGGRSIVPGYGARIQLAPAVSPEAVGGPLLDSYGRVVGILGGSLTPGARVERRAVKSSQGLWTLTGPANAATAISEVPRSLPATVQSLEELARAGILTPSITAMPEFLYGGTVATLPKRAEDPMPPDAAEFSPRDAVVNVYSFWKREAKISKGEISASVYDVGNHVRVTIPPKKFTLRDEPTRISFGFAPTPLQPGLYRIDLLWDGRPAWRTFIRITE